MSIKAAAIALETRVGDVAHNLALVETMVVEAAAKGARIVALPEFFTSAITPDERPYAAVLGEDNRAVTLLQHLAHKHKIWIGGSLLQQAQDQIMNRYVLVEPSQAMHTHDKDLPTMWENAFYTGGQDDGVWETELGTAGAAMCWELIRQQSLRRMAGRVQWVITGTHWWTLPHNWPGLGPDSLLLRGLAHRNAQLSESAPAAFARHLQVPVIQASHCGCFEGRFRLLAGRETALRYRSHFVGATQIVNAQGEVLAMRRTQEGPGIAYADIDIPRTAPAQAEAGSGFWIPRLPKLMRLYWHQQNWANRPIYDRRGRRLGLEGAACHTAPDSNPVTQPKRTSA